MSQDWLDARIQTVCARGREWLTSKLLNAGSAKPYLHVYTVDEEPAPGGIPVIRLKNGDYMFAPAGWAIPDEVLDRYRTNKT